MSLMVLMKVDIGDTSVYLMWGIKVRGLLRELLNCGLALNCCPLLNDKFVGGKDFLG